MEDDELRDIDAVDSNVLLLLLKVVDPRLEVVEGGVVVVGGSVDPVEIEVLNVRIDEIVLSFDD